MRDEWQIYTHNGKSHACCCNSCTHNVARCAQVRFGSLIDRLFDFGYSINRRRELSGSAYACLCRQSAPACLHSRSLDATYSPAVGRRLRGRRRPTRPVCGLSRFSAAAQTTSTVPLQSVAGTVVPTAAADTAAAAAAAARWLEVRLPSCDGVMPLCGTRRDKDAAAELQCDFRPRHTTRPNERSIYRSYDSQHSAIPFHA